MPIVQDTQEIRISAVSSTDRGSRQSHRRDRRRMVTLYRTDVPELPESLADDGFRSTMKFHPEKVVIHYRDNDTILEFDEVRLIGPNIRKDGSHGERTGNVRYFVMPESVRDEERRQRAGEYILPDYLADLVRLYDPHGEAHPFAATDDVLLEKDEVLS